MLKNQLTTLLIILSSFVLGICKNEILKPDRELKFRGEPVKSALSVYASDITRRNNETKIRALINSKRLPTSNVTNSTISLNRELEKIAREHHHHVDDGSYSESYDHSHEVISYDDKDDKKKKKKKKHHHKHKHHHHGGHRKKFKFKKKFKKRPKHKKMMKKFMMPLLIAYKLKFFTLIPLFVAGLLLLVKTAGLAGFFFALFSVSMIYLKFHNPEKSMISILTEEVKTLPSPPAHHDHDQHTYLAINNDYHYADYDEVPYDYHYHHRRN